MRPLVLAATLGCALAATLTACGDDGERSDAERFCGEAVAGRDAIVSPPLGTEAELAATLDFYRLMGQLAPVAIAAEWNDLVVALETASTVVPGDPQSEQRVAERAYATERSAFAVKSWLQDNCGLDIPIATIAPQAPVPAATTTTAPAAPTTAPE